MPPASSAGGTTDHQLVSYELRAPAWRPPLLLVQPQTQSSSSSLGHSASTSGAAAYPELFPGTTSLYPHHPTGSLGGAGSNLPGGGSATGSASTAATPAREDDLSEAVVKSGFVNRAIVQGEAASIFPFIHEKLLKGPTLPILSSLVAAVLERKHLEAPSLASPAGPIPGRALPVATGTSPWQQDKPVIVPNPGPWTYKPPSRVVFNATRLENWYSELANPNVPLSKLSKNIPSNPSSSAASTGSSSASGGIGHISSGVGTYGAGTSTAPRPSATTGGISSGADKPTDKNLDMLLHRAVPIDRAMWFLRSVGQAEIQQLTKVSLKSSASASHSGTSSTAQTNPALTYSIDFTNSLLDFLKRQLAEIVLPLIHHATLQASGLAGRAGMSVKGKARNILAEEVPKERWLKRWAYSMELVRETIGQGLVESGRWASGLLEMIEKCHIAQLEWWLDILRDTALDDVSQKHGWTAKQIVATLLDKLLELEGAQPTVLEEAMRDEALLVASRAATEQMLRALWEQSSAAFFQPRIWRERSDTKLVRLRSIAVSTSEDEAAWHKIERRVRRVLGREDESLFRKYQALQLELYDPDESTACTASEVEAGRRRNGLSGTWSMPSLGTLAELLDRFSPYDSVQETFHVLFPPSVKALPSPLQSAGLKAPPPTPRTPLSTPTAARPVFVSSPQDTIRGLLMWATSSLRTGDHRRYLVTSLLKRFMKSDPPDPESAIEDVAQDRARLLQKTLLEWLDILPFPPVGPRQIHRQKATVDLFALLADEHLLDVARVLQTAVSRGIGYHTGFSPSIHISVLQEVQAEGLSRPLAAQMKRFLDRIRSKVQPVHDHEGLQGRLRLFLAAEAKPPPEHGRDMQGTAILQASPPDSEGPDIQMQSASPDSPFPPVGQPVTAAERDVLQTVRDLGPQQQRWILRRWLLPELTQQSSWTPAVITRAARLFHAGSEYQSLDDFLRHILASSAIHRASILSCILNVIDHMALMWTCTDSLPSIAASLWTTHRRLVSEGGISKLLLTILSNLGHSGCITAAQLSDLALDVRAYLGRFSAPHLSEPLASGSLLDGFDGLEDIDFRIATLVARHGASPGFPAEVLDCLLYSLETGSINTATAALIYGIVQDMHPEGLEAVLVSKLANSAVNGETVKLWRQQWLPRLLSLLSAAGSLSPASLLHTLVAPPLRVFLDTPSPPSARAEAAVLLDALQHILCESPDQQQSHEESALCPSPARQLAAMRLLPLLREVELAASTDSSSAIAKAASKLRTIILSAPGAKVFFLQNVSEMATFYLDPPLTQSESRDRLHTLASLDVLAEALNVVKLLKDEGGEASPEGGARPRGSLCKSQTAANMDLDSVEESAFFAGVNRVELQAYLRRAEVVAAAEEQGTPTVPRVALEEDGFAQRFLEDLLSEPGDGGTNERDKQLSAFTGKAVDQLLRAVLRSMCTSLEVHANDASTESSLERLLKLAPILRRFVLPEEATLGMLESEPSLCQRFVSSWLKAAETLLSRNSPVVQARQAMLQLLTLYDVLTLVTGNSDVWITRQADLVDAVKVTLQLANIVCTPDLADVRSLLVDMASYLLTFAVGASTRLLALRSFRPGPLAVLSSPVRALGILSEPATATFWQDGQQYLGSANPWELADHIDPPQTSARDDVQHNSAAIDLGRLQATTLELDTAPLPAQSRGPSSAFHLGDQRNFEFEIPFLQESVWQRDFRRSNTAQMDLPASAAVTVSDEASASQSAGQKDTSGNGTGSNEAHRSTNPAKIAAAGHAQSSATVAGPPGPSNAKKAAPKKRKSVPDAPREREEEEPKRKKVAAKTTVAKKK